MLDMMSLRYDEKKQYETVAEQEIADLKEELQLLRHEVKSQQESVSLWFSVVFYGIAVTINT